jgi:Dolichyl-phosphate-mannose-protein mannosyltransferase
VSETATRESDAGGFRQWLLLVTLAGLVVRVAFLLLEPRAELAGDEPTWTTLAIRGLAHLRKPFSPLRSPIIFYPPGYPYFVGTFYALFESLAAVKWAQVVVGTLLIGAVGRVGRLVFSARVGLGAAAVTAFYPELVWFSVHFWSETLFVTLLWWAFERVLASAVSGRWQPAVPAGLLWGAACLTRETDLYFTPLVAVWLLLGRGRSNGRAAAAAFVLASALVVAPWTWRNWVVFEAFVPVSTFGAHALWEGNTRLPREEFYRQTDAVPGPIAQYGLARERAWQAIRERQPTWLLEKVRSEVPALWAPATHISRLLDNDAYGSGKAAMRWVGSLSVLVYVVVLAAALPGLAALRLDRPRILLLLFVAYSSVIHVLTFADDRFRLPVMPVLFLAAADAWTAWRAGAFPDLSPRRLALLAILFVAAAFLVGASTGDVCSQLRWF